MNRGRPIPPLKITEQEREELETIVHRRRSAVAEVKRAKAILLSAAGHSNFEVSRRMDVCSHSVGLWRRCFLKGRVKGLVDLRIQGPARRINSEKVTEVIRLTLECNPTQGMHWSTRALAKKIGLSHASIAHIWECFGLKPHPQRGFQLSTDPFLVEKVRNIAGLYMSPAQNAVVFCTGKKSRSQMAEHNDEVFSSGPDKTEHLARDYYQQRALSLFAALALGAGGVYADRQIRHTHLGFLDFLRECESRTSGGYELHIVLDNHVAEKTMEVHRWLARHTHWVIHLIPDRSSWLCQVERFFGEIIRQRFALDLFRNLNEMCAAMLGYIDRQSLGASPFNWCALPESDCGKIVPSIDCFAARALNVVS